MKTTVVKVRAATSLGLLEAILRCSIDEFPQQFFQPYSIICTFSVFFRSSPFFVVVRTLHACQVIKSVAPQERLQQSLWSPFIILALLSRSLSVVAQIWKSHSGPSFPLPNACGACLHFFHREKSPAFSSLVDSRRIVPTHAARRSRQVILRCIFAYKSQYTHCLGNRTQGPTLVYIEYSRVTTILIYRLRARPACIAAAV